MRQNPLAPPADTTLLCDFQSQFGLQMEIPPLRRLKFLISAFAHLPYENLTKILKEAEFGRCERARRLPAEVISDYRSLGTGGTCFALTATLLHLVRSLGWEAEPLLADRPYGENTHCALQIRIDGKPHLVDPGFLIVDPIPLDGRDERPVETSFSRLVLSPRRLGTRVDLYTVRKNRRNLRLSFKTRPADSSEFLEAWDASFGWDMMRYFVLSRVCNSGQLYLRGVRYQVRSGDNVSIRELAQQELIGRIAADFGIDPSVSTRALSILRARGEFHGEAGTR
jgi:arylamine N-acetyltransferase